MIDLERATQALREDYDGTTPQPARTRARIFLSLHEGRHRRRVRWWFGVPLAVIFAGSTAFAGARGDLSSLFTFVTSSFRSWTEDEPLEAPKPLPGAQKTKATPAKTPLVSKPEEAHPSDEAEETAESDEEKAFPKAASEPEEMTSTPSPRARAFGPPASSSTRARKAPDARSAAPGSESKEARHLDLYRRAHEAHFQERDCERGLLAYDRYLAADPRGRLVPEAQYNRALCLVRLGRREPARRALEPFAAGKYGRYRQREAQELLEALR